MVLSAANDIALEQHQQHNMLPALALPANNHLKVELIRVANA